MLVGTSDLVGMRASPRSDRRPTYNINFQLARAEAIRAATPTGRRRRSRDESTREVLAWGRDGCETLIFTILL